MTKRDKRLKHLSERVRYAGRMMMAEVICTLICLCFAVYAYIGSLEPHAPEELTRGNTSNALMWVCLAFVSLIGYLYHSRVESKASEEIMSM